MLTIFLLAIFYFAFGCVKLFNQDYAWRLQDKANRRRGIISERTDEWESSNEKYGYLMILFGVAFLIILLILFVGAHDKPTAAGYLDGKPLTAEESREFDRNPTNFFNRQMQNK